MKNSTRLKLFVSFLLGLSGALFLTYASTNVSIQANVNTFVQFIDRIVFSMTTSQERDEIEDLTAGTVIYNSDLQVHQAWNGTHWYNLGAACTSIFSIQVTNVSYSIVQNYGGGYLRVDGASQGTSRFGEIEVNGNNEEISVYSMYLKNNRILSPQEQSMLAYYNTEVSSNTLGWGRTPIGGYINPDDNTATIYLCGALSTHELEVSGQTNGMLQQNQTGGAFIIEARNTGIEDLEDVQIWIDIANQITIINTNGGTQTNVSSGTTRVTRDLGTITAGDTIQRNVDILPTQAGTFYTNIDGSTSSPEGNPNNQNSIYTRINQATGGQASLSLSGGNYTSAAAGTTITVPLSVINSCGSPTAENVQVTASWTNASGAAPTLTSAYSMYSIASTGINSATWNISSMYTQPCSQNSFSLSFYNANPGETNIIWTVTASNSQQATTTHYAVWTSGGSTGGSNTNISISANSSVTTGGLSSLSSSSVLQNICGSTGSNVTITASRTSNNGVFLNTSGTTSGYTSGGNSVSWNVANLLCTAMSTPVGGYTITLNPMTSGSATVTRTVTASNAPTSTATQTLNWTSGGGGGASYDYSIVSGNWASFSAEPGQSLSPSIAVGGDAYNGCMAGYGIQVTASRGGAGTTSYMSSSAGPAISGTQSGTNVTRTYTGSDSMGCSYFTSNYSVTLHNNQQESNNITWTVGPANGGSTDPIPSNNTTSQTLNWTSSGGGGGSGNNVDLYFSGSNYVSGAEQTALTGTAFVLNNSGTASSGSITVTASIPPSGSVWWSVSATNADSTSGSHYMEGGNFTRYNVNIGEPLIIQAYSSSTGSININRQVNTTDNDTNIMNNNYNTTLNRQ